MMKKDPLGYGNKPSADARTERKRTANEMARQGLAGTTNAGPEVPLGGVMSNPKTPAGRRMRLAQPGNPKKGGGVVGPTMRKKQ